MKKNTPNESVETKALKDIGFEFEAPQDEFSYQPDTGSIGEGNIAKDENGIDVDLDAEGLETSLKRFRVRNEDSDVFIPGESEWSQRNRKPVEESEEELPELDDDSLKSLVQDRFSHHPHLRQYSLQIAVRKGTVFVEGEVHSAAARLLVSEIVSALPGVVEIQNTVNVVMKSEA